MKKLVSALAAAVILPWMAHAQDTEFNEAELYEKAKQEGELTWYVGSYVTEAAEAIGAQFTEKYPGVQVNVIRASGAVVYSRLEQDFQAGVAQCDVFGATDVGHAITLKEAGRLQQFRTANEADLYPQFQNMDPDGYYTLTASQATVMIYNTQLLSEDQVPKRWEGLADPKWQDKLSFGHPAYSGTMGSWVSAMIAMYGEEFIKTLADLNSQVGRSMSDPVANIGLGERQLGTGTLSVVLTAIASGNPIAVIIPEEGILPADLPTMIPVNAPHPNAARLFINFIQSPELQEWISKNHNYTPINTKTPVPEGVPAPADLKPVDLPPEDIAAGVPEALEVWRDYFGG